MAAPLPLRSDFDAAELRPSRRSRDPDQTQRLLTLVGSSVIINEPWYKASINALFESGFDASRPLRFEFVDQPFGFACLREDRMEGIEKYCLVEPPRVAPVARGQPGAGDTQHFGRDLAEPPPMDRRRKAEARYRGTQLLALFRAPVLYQVPSRVQRRRLVKEPYEKSRKRRKEWPGSSIGPAHFEIAFQPYFRKNGG
jgi:hypothetical protein